MLLSAHSLLLDEAWVAVAGRDILRNHTPMWDACSNAPFVWMVAHIEGLRGLSDPFLLRLPAAIIGSLTVIPLYALSRRMFGHPTATIAVMLFALHPFAVAFSRIMFADPFQTFFIVCGLLGFDYYIRDLDVRSRSSNRAIFFLLLVCVWGLSFLMKHNAIVPGVAWLGAGIVTGRYHIGKSVACLLSIVGGGVIALALWPLDAPIWFAAFLEKGGRYDLIFSAFYFIWKSHLLFFGLTEIVLTIAILLSLLRRKEDGKSMAQTTWYVVIYLVFTIILGRTFQRYIVALAPFACLLLASIAVYGFRLARTATRAWQRIAAWCVTIAGVVIFLIGAIQHFDYYRAYLQNDVDKERVTQDVISLEQHRLSSPNPLHGFWLMPDHSGAWYLGFTQDYSRALQTKNSAGPDVPLADINYFEWRAVPYAKEVVPYHVLSIRQMAHRWGVWRIVTHLNDFVDSATNIAATMRVSTSDSTHSPVASDYLTSDLVRPGDMLVMFGGFSDAIGEPIVEKIDARQTPPYFQSLPLDNFYVYRAYEPGGISNTTDTTIDPVHAKAWILIKK